MTRSKSTRARRGPDSRTGFSRAFWLAAILGATAIAYLPSLDNDFVNWDDPQYVVANPQVLRPDLATILTKPVAANYHPLTILSLAANHKWWGAGPRSYHVVNLALHLANTALVFAFVWMLTGGRRWTTVVTAALFGLHPTHVESVAWISGRKDVLYAFFYALGLIAYLRYLDARRWWWWAATSVAFVLSLASKPAAVVFPVTLLLIDAFRGRAWSARLLTEKAAWFAVSVVAGLLTIHAQKEGGALAPHWDPAARALIALYGLAMYVVKLVAPFGLSAIYPLPWAEGQSPGALAWGAAAAAAVGIVLAALRARRHRAVGFGIPFFVVNLALVLQFVAVGKAAMADRYTYLPYVGLVFAMAWFLDEGRAGARAGAVRGALAAGFVALVPICGAITWARCEVWRNSETLWTDTIRHAPDRAVSAYINRGYYYHREVGDYRKALADYDKAIAIDPAAAQAWNDRGVLYWEMGRRDSALSDFNRAIAIRPAYDQAWNNRGGVKLEGGDLAGAVADATRALELSPEFRGAYANRAVAYGAAGQHRRAIADAGRALALAPDHPESYVMYGLMGTSSVALGQNAPAVAALDRAIRLAPAADPRRGGYLLARSQARAALGDRAGALQDAREAMRLDPDIHAAYQKATGAGGP